MPRTAKTMRKLLIYTASEKATIYGKQSASYKAGSV